MFKDFSWWAFDETRLADFVCGPKAEIQPPFSNLVSVLRELGCASVLVEEQYIDRDYKNEFANFYCKPFKIYSPRCVRLHYLTRTWSTTSSFDLNELKQKEYLGFSVIRPTAANKVGRSLIRWPTRKNEYLTCGNEFDVHLLGNPYHVRGFPFIQQDTHVGVCAHASLWMVARYMHARGFCGQYGLGDINTLAKRFESAGRDLPSDQGLSQQQLLDALQGIGLSATLYDLASLPENSDSANELQESLVKVFKTSARKQIKHLFRSIRLAELAYRYVESRLPVIFVTVDHVFVGIGHGFNPAVNPAVGAPALFERIPYFIVHDDSYGPYQTLPILPQNTKKSKTEKSKQSTRLYNSALDVTGLIVVTPSSVNLLGEQAESEARSMIEQLRNLSESKPGFQHFQSSLNSKHEYRTYLLDSRELQHDLRMEAKSRPSESHIHELLRLDYPHYVWVVEIFVWEGDQPTNSGASYNRRCVGRCFIDSTGSRLTSNLLYFGYGPLFILRDRQGKTADITGCETSDHRPAEKQIAQDAWK